FCYQFPAADGATAHPCRAGTADRVGSHGQHLSFNTSESAAACGCGRTGHLLRAHPSATGTGVRWRDAWLLATLWIAALFPAPDKNERAICIAVWLAQPCQLLRT